jgi:hypothetical protein
MQPSIVAGICVGVATGAWMFGEYALGLHDDPAGAGRWTGFLALVFPLIGAWWIATRAAMPTWPQALREGVVFGVVGGLVGAAAIFIYFSAVNPGFTVAGHRVDAGSQALVGFVGALVLGTVLTLIMAAVVGPRGRANG